MQHTQHEKNVAGHVRPGIAIRLPAFEPSTSEAELLRAVAALLNSPGRWISGVSAVDKNGISVSPFSKEACALCVCGAVSRLAATSGLANKTIDALNRISALTHGMGIIPVNDTRSLGLQAVLATIQERLAALSQKQ